MSSPKIKKKKQPFEIIGWRETIAFPEFGIEKLTAKIDTGARTSALDATDIRLETIEGVEWVSFHISSKELPKLHRCKAKLIDRRKIKNTSGIPEERYVIETKLHLGKRKWRIEISLADRGKMAHDIILGRTAIRRHKILVAPGKSFLSGIPH